MHGGGQAQLVDIGHFGHNRAHNQPPAFERMIAIGPKASATNGDGKIDILGLAEPLIVFFRQFRAENIVEQFMRDRIAFQHFNFAIGPNGQITARTHMKIGDTIFFWQAVEIAINRVICLESFRMGR